MSEDFVATLNEIADGGTREVRVEGNRVLLVRINDAIHAVGAECPHAGGNLAEGSVCDGHVRCPWHQARFDARTGKMEEPPSLEDIPHFDVRVVEDRIYVDVPEEAGEGREDMRGAGRTAGDDRLFVIVGAGAAGAAAAETLRKEGFTGRLKMISREDTIPYDRTKLSKSYLMIPAGDSFPPGLRSQKFYAERDIEIEAGREVTALNPAQQLIELDDGSSFQYDAALLATGSRARRCEMPGSELDNVFYLHNLAQADRIREGLDDADAAVVLGASFIGMESAAALTTLGLDVTIIAPEEQPFARVLGAEVGEMLRGIHESEGVSFRMGHVADALRGDRKIESVVLDDGEELDADIAIIGIGVIPETEYIRGLDLREDGSVPVDEHMQAADNLYAAGDIASFPDPRGTREIRVEHWRLALQHGRIAAFNMAGTPTTYSDIPFFWTDQHGKMLRYVGHAEKWDEIIIDGELDQQDFIAYYVSDDCIAAAAGLGRDRQMAIIAELMRAEPELSHDAVIRCLSEAD